MLGAPVGQEMQISVEISDLKRMMNDIEDVPTNDDLVPQKVDNDLESSDVGFSDGQNDVVDEHAYQIGELGQF